MMKKNMLLTLMLFVAMSIQAQSLIGTWKTAPTVDEDGDATTWFFTFKQGTQFSLRMEMATEDKEIGKIVFGLTMPGTYTKSGSTITIKLDPKKSVGKIEKMELTGDLAALIKDSPEMKKTIEKMLQEQVDNEIKKGFEDQPPFDGDLTIIKLTSNQLELQSDDEMMNFTRVQQKK